MRLFTTHVYLHKYSRIIEAKLKNKTTQNSLGFAQYQPALKGIAIKSYAKIFLPAFVVVVFFQLNHFFSPPEFTFFVVCVYHSQQP